MVCAPADLSNFKLISFLRNPDKFEVPVYHTWMKNAKRGQDRRRGDHIERLEREVESLKRGEPRVSKRGRALHRSIVGHAGRLYEYGQRGRTVGPHMAGSTVNPPPKRPDLLSGAEGAVEGMLPNAVASYAASLSEPWENTGVRVPYHVNNLPTTDSMTAKTTANFNTTVALNTRTQITLFPGHGESYAAEAVDLVSAHSIPQRVGVTDYIVGPVDHTAPYTAICGAVTPGLVTTGVGSSTSTTPAGTLPIAYDVSLPFVSNSAAGHHTRWRLVSMGVKIINLTPDLDIGGSITSVQPNTLFVSDDISDYAKFNSFQICEAKEDFVVTWIPRGQDVSFWHLNASGFSSTVQSAGLIVSLLAPAAKAQEYQISVVCNWEIAGSSIRALATPAINHPTAGNTIAPSIEMLHGGAPDARAALQVATVVNAAGDSGFARAASKAVGFVESAMSGISNVAALASSLLPADLAITVGAQLGENLLPAIASGFKGF